MGIIRTKGIATISVQPDYVKAVINVKTKVYDELEKANDSALDAIEKVKAACIEKGIDTKNIHIVGFTHNNIYKTIEKEITVPWSREKQKTKEQVFDGYQSTATLNFGFDFSMHDIADMFERLSKIENITYKLNYTVKDVEGYINTCKQKALKNAIETAEILASTANVDIQGIESISYENEFSNRNSFYEAETGSVRKMKTSSVLEDLGVSDIVFTEQIYLVVKI